MPVMIFLKPIITTDEAGSVCHSDFYLSIGGNGAGKCDRYGNTEASINVLDLWSKDNKTSVNPQNSTSRTTIIGHI